MASYVFSADGKRIAGNEISGGILIWDLEPPKLVATVGKKISAGRMPVAISRDGSWVVGTKSGRDVAVWDVNSGTELMAWRPHLGRIESLAISPDELMIATTSDDGCVKLWERRSGVLLVTLPIAPAKGRILEVAFSPDGFYVATVNGNGTAYLIEAPRGLLSPAKATAPGLP